MVDESGVRLQCGTVDLTDYESLKRLEPYNRLGRLLPTLIPQLLQLGVAHLEGHDIVMAFHDFVELEGTEIDAFDDLVPWSPFSVELEAKGFLGLPDLRYEIRLYWGNKQVFVERIGCFVKRGEKIYRLERQLLRLLEAIEAFNSLDPLEKTRPDILLKFAEIKGIAGEIGAKIDQYILKEKVIVPAKINLDLIEEKDGRISFVPKIDRVPDEELFRVFMASDNVDNVYFIPDGEGGRIRVVLDEAQKEALRRMRKVRHLGGADKAKVLRNPYEVFDGVANAISIDLAMFGPRVKGLGDFPFVSVPFIKYEGTGIFGMDSPGGPESTAGKFNAGIDCRYPDGTVKRSILRTGLSSLSFATSQELHGKPVSRS